MDDAKTQGRSVHDWQALSELTRGRPVVVERVRLVEQGVAIEGAFELPRLAQLSAEDQVFVAAFVRSHGSIKEMEQVFGVSYPTIKARLNRIAASLEFVETDPEPRPEAGRAPAARQAVLDRLARGEITADQAVAELGGKAMIYAPRAIRHFSLAGAEARAQRTARAMSRATPSPPLHAVRPEPARPRRRVVIRLWLPLTAIFLLLSPFALLLAPCICFAPRPYRTRPLATVLGVGRLLLSLGGTVVHVDTPEALVSIRVF